ncbi:MAG: phenylacetate--CoA ligase [Desulfobacteraceae bacterium IS3]|nr:MAG: phenylacetate--CoA ligase [Desulfobacteraceae bacterium IS3]
MENFAISDNSERLQLQLERLQSTLNRAYRNVPFHQNRLNGLASVESMADFIRLPFMERQHLGEYYPYGLFAVPLRDIVRIHTAPGTGANPIVSGYTRQDLQMWQTIVAESLKAAGVGTHDILQINLDAGLANWGRDYKDGAEAIGAGVIPNTVMSSEKQLMILRDYRTSVLITTPSSAFQLAELMFKANLNPTSLNLKTLILVGEWISPELRKELEEQLHVITWLHYGLSEVPGPAVAFECRQHEGLHINEDHFIAEIIDPTSGEILPQGEVGELVLSTLTTRAFPLIRFRTGDRARLMKSPCTCGRELCRIQWLEGRTDDILSINGVKAHQDQITRHLELALGFSPIYRYVIRKRRGVRDCLEVWIAIGDGMLFDEIKSLEKLINDAKDKLEENLSVPVSVRLKEKSSFSE